MSAQSPASNLIDRLVSAGPPPANTPPDSPAVGAGRLVVMGALGYVGVIATKAIYERFFAGANPEEEEEEDEPDLPDEDDDEDEDTPDPDEDDED